MTKACKVASQEGSLRVKESVREWILTLPKELPLWGGGVRWTPECLESDCKGQNQMDWRVLHTIRKILKCRCLKWARMTHLDIWNTSYGQKKGRESNWQFDSQSLKVRNRPDFLAFRWRATYCWKTFDKGYNFVWDLISIGGLHTKLWGPKVGGVPILAISRIPLGSPGTKSHLDVGLVERHRVCYKGEGGGFLQVWAVVSLVSSSCMWLVLTLKVFQLCTNHLVLVSCRFVWVVDGCHSS